MLPTEEESLCQHPVHRASTSLQDSLSSWATVLLYPEELGVSVHCGSHVWSQLLIAVNEEETGVLPVETTAIEDYTLRPAQSKQTSVPLASTREEDEGLR